MNETEKIVQQTIEKLGMQHERCGGGMHYDSCQRCQVESAIREALSLRDRQMLDVVVKFSENAEKCVNEFRAFRLSIAGDMVEHVTAAHIIETEMRKLIQPPIPTEDKEK